jgi:hypothetical protein
MNNVQEIILPDGGKVVLFDPPMSARGLVENLVCLDVDGNVRWKMAPPYPLQGEVDFFTAVTLEADQLLANTWGSYLITIDPKTGAASKSIFTK